MSFLNHNNSQPLDIDLAQFLGKSSFINFNVEYAKKLVFHQTPSESFFIDNPDRMFYGRFMQPQSVYEAISDLNVIYKGISCYLKNDYDPDMSFYQITPNFIFDRLDFISAGSDFDTLLFEGFIIRKVNIAQKLS